MIPTGSRASRGPKIFFYVDIITPTYRLVMRILKRKCIWEYIINYKALCKSGL